MASGWEEVAATSQAALSVLGPGLALGAPPADSEVPGAHFRPPTLGPRTSEKAGQPRARVQHDPRVRRGEPGRQDRPGNGCGRRRARSAETQCG